MKENLISLVNRIHSEYKGAFYLFNIEKLFSWFDFLDERLKKELGADSSLVYAIKANPFLTEFMDEKVDSFEVCSPGEFEICKKKNISSEKIVFSGVYKSKESISRIFEDGFSGIVTLESENHYKLLKEVMSEKNISNARILPRLSSGNKFGMDEEEILLIIKDALNDKRFLIEGIQYFSGTQKKKIKVIHEELAVVDEFCKRIERETGFSVGLIEYGPGFFFDYYSDTDHIDAFDDVVSEIKPYSDKYRFALESGRFLSAGCGEYVTEIVDIKSSFGKNYLLVDGGIHHVNYYGRMLGMNNPHISHLRGEAERPLALNAEDSYEVGGALCTVSDVLLKNCALESPALGDLLVFHDAGAYSCMESPVLFLSRTMPRVFAYLPSGEVKMLRDVIESFEFNS